MLFGFIVITEIRFLIESEPAVSCGGGNATSEADLFRGVLVRGCGKLNLD
jgi:hypothetical protein